MATQILGLDVEQQGAAALVRAVVVDGDGTVLRRAQPADGAVLQGFNVFAFGVAYDAVDGDRAAVRSHLPVALGAAGDPHIVDAGAAAVAAESWVGAAREASDAICLVISDRVTAGILLGGKPWRGAHGRAGSAAWLALNPVERQDYRKLGSLAAEVSDKGIGRRLSWRIQAGDHSSVLEKAGDLDSITGAHVFDGARAGDGVSISVVRDTAKYIGMAIANLAVTLDPEVIVLAGSVAAAGDLLLEPVRQECARRLPPGMAAQLRIEISPLGDDGVAIGAARLAMLARA